MRLERWFFGSLVYPAYHALARDHVLGLTREYEINQWKSTTEIQDLQSAKLAKLLQHAALHVPHYRQLFGVRGRLQSSTPHLSDWPRLTKATIRTKPDSLIATNIARTDLEPNSTSGSTGEPLYFYTDGRSSACRKASVIRNRRWAGIELGDREVRLWGSPLDKAQAQRLRGRVHGWLTRTLMLSAYDLSSASLGRYLQVMRSYRPKLLIAYPSVLELLAGEMLRTGTQVESLKAIIVSAETLYPHQRDIFRTAFQAEVYNRYGSREVGDVAQECAVHDGLHINADRVVVEIVRDDLTPCAPGEVGEVLVTDLNNYGMPFIRYAIGDRAAVSRSSRCPCGRGLPLLAEVAGRSMDIIRFPNGVSVGGTYWTFLLRTKPGIDQFQVVQEAPDEVQIRYVSQAEVAVDTLAFVERDVRSRAGENFRVRFKRVADLPRGAGGKHRLVVNNLRSEEAVALTRSTDGR